MVLFILAATIGTVSAACEGLDVKQYVPEKTKTKKSCATPSPTSELWTDSCEAGECPEFGPRNVASCKKYCSEEIRCNFFGGTPKMGCEFFESCAEESASDVFPATTTTFKKVCKGTTPPPPSPTDAPTDPPVESVCSGSEKPRGSMMKRCAACLGDAKYTSENCEFDTNDMMCKASGKAKKAVTDPAKCPSKGANKKRPGGKPAKKLPEMCGGDACCLRGKARGAAILQSAKGVTPKVFLIAAASEYECAAECTGACEWWTYDKKKRSGFPDGSCILYKTSKNGKKTADAPTGEKNMKSRRHISGNATCKPTKPMAPSGGDDDEPMAPSGGDDDEPRR